MKPLIGSCDSLRKAEQQPFVDARQSQAAFQKSSMKRNSAEDRTCAAIECGDIKHHKQRQEFPLGCCCHHVEHHSLIFLSSVAEERECKHYDAPP